MYQIYASADHEGAVGEEKCVFYNEISEGGTDSELSFCAFGACISCWLSPISQMLNVVIQFYYFVPKRKWRKSVWADSVPIILLTTLKVGPSLMSPST